jgi:adenylyltransferase and sulfurtransferase
MYKKTNLLESDLLDHEIDKFSRQIIVPGVNIEGQISLRNSSVLIVGCGGLGSPLIMYMASCGIGTLGIMDHDRIEIHNLQRQVLFKEADIGKYKVDCAYKFIKDMNSMCKIDKYKLKIGLDDCDGIISKYDVIVDCTDNIQARYILSDTSKKFNKDFVCASVIRWEGHFYLFKKDGPCYRCIYPNMKKSTVSCDENGIIGPVCGLFGSLLGLEIIKIILDVTDTKMIRYNGMTNAYNNFKLRNRNPDCPGCNKVGKISLDEMATSCSSKINLDIYKDIPRKQWNEIIENIDLFTIIDVRSHDQYRMLRIRNSKNIPLADLINRIEDIKKNKNVAILCKKGISSLKGCKILQENGIESFSIDGGIDEYSNKYKNKFD